MNTQIRIQGDYMKKNSFYKRTITIIVLFLLINISFLSTAGGKTTEEKSTQINETVFYAVIAACSRYENPAYNIPKKPFQPIPESKLMVLYDSLLSAKNWEKENIILLLNENATKSNILSAIQEMSEIVTENDIFVFSWSGHGSQVAQNNNSSTTTTTEEPYKTVICPYDMNIENQTMVNYICSTQLDQYFSNITAKGQILLFECCLSGGLVSEKQTMLKNKNQAYTLDVDGENRVVIMSTPADFIGRATFTTGYPLINSFAIVFDKYIQDENNDGFLSIQKAFKPARILTLIQSSFYFIGIWLYSFIIFKFNINRGLPNIFTLFFRDNPWILATITTIQSYIQLQLFTKQLVGHYMLNWPNMRDDHPSELPIIIA
jgi:hypothetical protein